MHINSACVRIWVETAVTYLNEGVICQNSPEETVKESGYPGRGISWFYSLSSDLYHDNT
jgi:hypothetical protein